MRRTKIVATLGPASGSPEVIGSLIDAGMDVARLGLAHGTAAEHLAAISLVRDLARERGRTVGVLADLPGPKVRTGAFPEGGAFLSEGDEVDLSAGDGPSSAEHIVVDEDALATGAHPLFDWEVRSGTTARIQEALVSLGALRYEEPASERVLVDRSLVDEVVAGG